MMNVVTLKELKAACDKNEGDMRQCFTSTRTVWWASGWKQLHKGPVPLDVFGAPLFQSEKTDQYFDEEAVRAHANVYGKYPVTTWTMAHARNLEQLGKEMPEAFPDQLKDVSNGYAHFGKIIEGLVDAGKIPNMDAQ